MENEGILPAGPLNRGKINSLLFQANIIHIVPKGGKPGKERPGRERPEQLLEWNKFIINTPDKRTKTTFQERKLA